MPKCTQKSQQIFFQALDGQLIYLFSYFVFARSVNSRLPRRMRRLVQMFAARRCGKHRLSAKYEYKSKTIQRCNSLSWVSSVSIHLSSSEILQVFNFTMGGSRGGIGVRTPWKITGYMVSIGDKQLDPPPWK